MMKSLFVPLAGLPMLAGCAPQAGQIPSLAPRAIEKTKDDAPVVKPGPSAAPADAALARTLTGIATRLADGERAFEALRLPTANAARRARGTAPGSEAWIAAQQQLTALEGAGGAAASALTDLDSLYLDRVNAAVGGGSPAGLDEIRALQVRAAALADAQRVEIEATKAALSR